ncbi:unnamed protein product [Hydatigera taeniaeformis]|uniref:Uncharacterized protein n=1 Tax=Hydatigena taeniaeformis TaxID=6205 RepID=A0A0R3WVG7_HYDTA|nr:unnamed protein product [Hydatigera taeniaeformis]
MMDNNIDASTPRATLYTTPSPPSPLHLSPHFPHTGLASTRCTTAARASATTLQLPSPTSLILHPQPYPTLQQPHHQSPPPTPIPLLHVSPQNTITHPHPHPHPQFDDINNSSHYHLFQYPLKTLPNKCFSTPLSLTLTTEEKTPHTTRHHQNRLRADQPTTSPPLPQPLLTSDDTCNTNAIALIQTPSLSASSTDHRLRH